MYGVPKVVFIIVCTCWILLFDGHLDIFSLQFEIDDFPIEYKPQNSVALKKSDINISSIVRRYSLEIQRRKIARGVWGQRGCNLAEHALMGHPGRFR